MIHRQSRGADDALLTAGDGEAAKSCTASLMWWEGDDLVLPDAEAHLPGVARALLVGSALARGVVVRRGRACVHDFYEQEVRPVDALHGLRPVSGWVGPVDRLSRPSEPPSPEASPELVGTPPPTAEEAA